MISRLLSLGATPALRTTLTHQAHTSLATRLVIQNPTWSRSISMTRPVSAEKAKKSAAKATKETKSKAKTTAAEDEAATKKSRPRVRKSVGRPESKAASKEKEVKIKVKFPKAPPTGFALFVREYHAKTTPVANLAAGAQLMKEIGAKWTALSEVEKQPYRDEAAKLAEAHKPVLEEFYKTLDQKTLKEINKKRAEKGLPKKHRPVGTKPPASAYAMFLSDFFQTRVANIGENGNFADASRAASQAWKEAEKEEWAEKFKQARAEWDNTHGKV